MGFLMAPGIPLFTVGGTSVGLTQGGVMALSAGTSYAAAQAGAGSVKTPRLLPSLKPQTETSVEAARSDLRERLKRARSRSSSRVAPFGPLELQAPSTRPVLGSTLG
jgi:hypothetical protein